MPPCKRAAGRNATGAFYAAAGREDFLTWTFEMKSDLVPGIWTFEIWSDGKKLTEQSFEIILPPTS